MTLEPHEERDRSNREFAMQVGCIVTSLIWVAYFPAYLVAFLILGFLESIAQACRCWWGTLRGLWRQEPVRTKPMLTVR